MSKSSEDQMPHKAAVAGRALFGRTWGQLSKKQQTEARELLDAIAAAPKEPRDNG